MANMASSVSVSVPSGGPDSQQRNFSVLEEYFTDQDHVKSNKSVTPSDGSAALSQSGQDGEKRLVSKLRISRADLEIITSQFPNKKDSDKDDVTHDASKAVENSGSENISRDCSDSDDMCRVFDKVKKKKKHKKKKKKNRSSSIDTNDSEFVADSEDDFQNTKRRKARNDLYLNEATLNQRAVMKALEDDSNVTKVSTKKYSSNVNSKHVNSVQDLSNEENNASESDKNAPPKLSVASSSILMQPSIPNNTQESSTINGEIGKINHESEDFLSKEQPSRARSGIVLPKPRKTSYKLHKVGESINYHQINSTFPVCYVVLKKLGELQNPCLKENWSTLEEPFPLLTRLKFLKEMCTKGNIKCYGKKKKKNKELYNHLFEVNNTSGQSDEEFQRSGKSLRRRNKNISYKELSEFNVPFAPEQMNDGLGNRKKKRARYDEDPNFDILQESDEDLNPKKKSKSSKGTGLGEKGKEKASTSTGTTSTVTRTGTTSTVTQGRRPGDEGPTQVIVYPKTSLPLASTTASSLPSNISTLSNSTNLLPMPSTVLPQMPQMSYPGARNMNLPFGPPVSSAFPMPVPTSINKPQYCMMKVDGKDVLVQLMPSTGGGPGNPGTQQVILPGGKRFVMSPPQTATRSIAPSLIRSPPGSRNILPNNAIPPQHARFVSSTSLPSVLVNQSVVGGNRLIAPHLGNITGISGTSVRLPISSSIATLGHVGAISSSTGSTVRPVTSNIATPIQSTTQIRTSLQSQILPGTGNMRQNLRLFVPGCSATGTPGHFTTLSTAAVGGSPLTRLSASSQLLPQKRAVDTELSAEEKAAKRRKLEKKYPLPPGVVIKTESLDTPPASAPAKAVSAGMRSLLQQNIQVFSTPRGTSGSGMQSIRIVSPSLASALTNSRPGGQPVRPVMYRTSNIRGSTLLVPYTTEGSSSVVSISSSSPLTSNTVTGSSSSASVITSSIASVNNTSSTNSTVSPALRPENGVDSSSSSIPSSSDDSSTLASNIQELQASQAALDSLRKLVKAQVALGLTGARMDKLKRLLQQKEDTVKALMTSSLSANCPPAAASGVNDIVGTASDPFVID